MNNEGDIDPFKLCSKVTAGAELCIDSYENTDPITIDLSEWHHYIWRRNSNSHALFIDGNFINYATDTSAGLTTINVLGLIHTGLIDEVAIWNGTAVEDVDILKIYNNGTVRNLLSIPDITHWWRFEHPMAAEDWNEIGDTELPPISWPLYDNHWVNDTPPIPADLEDVFEESYDAVEDADLDTRPRLGMFYWADKQPVDDWSALGGIGDDLEKFNFTFPPEWGQLECPGYEAYDSQCQFVGATCAAGAAMCAYKENHWAHFSWRYAHNFSPDVDVRLLLSAENNIDTPLFQYYDRKISPLDYTNSIAPGNVLFRIYPRMPGSVFEERTPYDVAPIVCVGNPADDDSCTTTDDECDGNCERVIFPYYYIAWIDWDDDSPLEYQTPELLGENQTIFHHYENWGVYNITGYILHYDGIEADGSVVSFKKFFLNIHLNKSIGHTDEFKAVGGDDYTYLPYDDTTAVIGGISDNSLYYRTLKKLAFDITDFNYMDNRDDLRSQIAYNNINENYTGPELLQFIGKDIDDDSTIYPDHDHDNAPFASNTIKGFFSGSNWNQSDGSIEDPVLIHYGYGRTPQELGDHLGDVDIGQARLFTTGSLDMWQMLGFEDPEAGTPEDPRYWKNIIPEEYLLSYRDGVDLVNDNIDPSSPQSWLDGSYYPVLPRVDRFGKFDHEKLGLQNDNIPFGSPSREWDEDDEIAPITNLNIEDPDLRIDLNLSSITDGVLEDNSGNENIGILINDFKVKLDSTVHPISVKFPTKAKLEKKPREQPL
jgi:hypothetical protein